MKYRILKLEHHYQGEIVMKKSEWFVYNAITERANPMEKAIFSSIFKAVKPNVVGSPAWNNSWKQFPEYSRAVVDYLKDPAWWSRVKILGDKILDGKNKKPSKKQDKKKTLK